MTFTASQGLLLMIPEMFRIAGELTPTVIHVAARTVATHALSIFGDHSDVMAVRPAGWIMLSSSTPQEAHDLAAVAHAATLEARLPVLHFMDGFRTSHELNSVRLLTDDELRGLVDDDALLKHGPEHAAVLIDHLRAWLEVRGYASVREMIGAVSQQKVPDPAAFERANYLATLTRYANERKGW